MLFLSHCKARQIWQLVDKSETQQRKYFKSDGSWTLCCQSPILPWTMDRKSPQFSLLGTVLKITWGQVLHFNVIMISLLSLLNWFSVFAKEFHCGVAASSTEPVPCSPKSAARSALLRITISSVLTGLSPAKQRMWLSLEMLAEPSKATASLQNSKLQHEKEDTNLRFCLDASLDVGYRYASSTLFLKSH